MADNPQFEVVRTTIQKLFQTEGTLAAERDRLNVYINHLRITRERLQRQLELVQQLEITPEQILTDAANDIIEAITHLQTLANRLTGALAVSAPPSHEAQTVLPDEAAPAQSAEAEGPEVTTPSADTTSVPPPGQRARKRQPRRKRTARKERWTVHQMVETIIRTVVAQESTPNMLEELLELIYGSNWREKKLRPLAGPGQTAEISYEQAFARDGYLRSALNRTVNRIRMIRENSVPANVEVAQNLSDFVQSLRLDQQENWGRLETAMQKFGFLEPSPATAQPQAPTTQAPGQGKQLGTTPLAYRLFNLCFTGKKPAKTLKEAIKPDLGREIRQWGPGRKWVTLSYEEDLNRPKSYVKGLMRQVYGQLVQMKQNGNIRVMPLLSKLYKVTEFDKNEPQITQALTKWGVLS